MNSFLKKSLCFLLALCFFTFGASLLMKVNAVNYESVMTDDFESYSTSTTYNSTRTAGDWTIYYGTVSTNSALTDSKSCQMRWYSSATSNKPYAIYTFTNAESIDKIAFNYKVSNTNVHFTVQYSSDGNTFTDIESVRPANTNKTLYSKELVSSISVKKLKIMVNDTSTAPSSGNYPFLIDDVVLSVKVADVPVSGVSLNKNSTSIAPGNTEQLTATVLPDNATNKAVTWSSDHENIATVSNSGLVTAVASGSATITATSQADGTKSASCVVTVTAAVAVTGVEAPATEFAYVGGTEQLVANVLPANASNKNVTWSSNDNSIATVSESGLVTAAASGNVDITVTTVDGDFDATCSFEVRALPSNNTEVTVLEAQKIAKACGDTASTNSYFTIGRVKAVTNSSQFVLTDEIDDIIVYKSSHGCSVNDRVKVLGKLQNYNLTTLQYSTNPSIVKLYNVIFESNGGSAVAGLVDVEKGNKISAPSAPVKSGYTFMGWYKEEELINQWNFASDTVTSSITLYAKYLDDTVARLQTDLNVIETYMALAYSYNGLYEGYGLTLSDMTFSGTGYTTFTSDNFSGYAFKSNQYIQLKSKDSISGIVLSNGTINNVTRVRVDWNNETVNGRTLNVYGSNSPYSAASDLYNEETDGDLLGTIVKGTSTYLDVTGDYTYIGVRASDGALYLDSLIIECNYASSVDFRLKCAVDEEIELVLDELVGEYGIEISDGTKTVLYSSENEYVYNESGKRYVVIDLKDAFDNIERLSTEFTVRAYVIYNENTYYSEHVKVHSVASILQTYIALNNDEINAQIEGLKNVLINLGLLD